MKAEAVIFDKDGTLVDFDAFWVPVAVKALEDVLAQFQREDIPVCKLLEPLGVRDGVTDINGVFCKGTYEQMGQVVYDVLRGYGCNVSCGEMISVVTDAFERHADAGEVTPTCPNLAEVLTALKQRNKRLAVVTTDNELITRKCLQKLGVEELFDKIYVDDGKTPLKPDPYCVEDFLQRIGLQENSIVVIGDTVTDVLLARNAGVAVIGLAKTAKNRAALSPMADAVIPSLSCLLDMLE